MLSFTRLFFAMGSNCEIHVRAENSSAGETAVAAAESEIRRIESRYSRFRADSELARINRMAAAGTSTDVDDETAALIDHALAYYTASDGAFDITSGLLRTAWDFSGSQLPDQRTIDALLPRIGLDKVTLSRGHLAFTHPGMELDFGGLAKEYAADSAAEICSGLGIRHGFVNLAGDIRVIGPQPNGLPWRIGIRHPRDPHVLAAVVALHDGALATSGDYERFIEIGTNRYCHILDPRTGWPAQGLRSVTVLAPCCLSAGILSTAAMVKGADGADWLRSLGVRHIVIDDRGSYVGTEPSGLRP